MRFFPSTLKGATQIEIDKREDDRGYFARTFCEEQFRVAGLPTRFVQANSAGTRLAGTLRGLHYQRSPHAETKLVRCTRGAVYDVILDLRPDSHTCGQWEGFELDAASGRMLLVPEGFAHGYQALADDTEVFYFVSHVYTPGAEAGIRFDDPAVGIVWPLPVTSISEKDQSWPDYQPVRSG
jgi:dTDP-4-dehydrorhamnose 3,5-epimerase